MSTQVITIKQGDTTDTFQISPFPLGETVEALTDAGWTCRSIVVPKLGGIELINNNVATLTTDNLYFETALGSPDTDILDAKAHIWILEMENLTTTPVYRKEHHISLVVQQQGAKSALNAYTELPIVTIGTSANSFTDKLVVVVTSDTIANILSNTGDTVVSRIELKNAAGTITQTVGYVSDTDGVVVGNREITILEPVIGTPVNLTVVSQ